MKTLTTTLLALWALSAGATGHDIAIAIHGGAGTISRDTITDEQEREYREALETALKIGWEVLSNGGTSLDAVEATIRFMEDSPLFNAGKGAVFTHEGRNELDASIMDGQTGQAGAVAGVTIIRHPISAARAVMDHSPHVLMAGHGADLFATKAGLEIVDPRYFWTERRWKALQERLKTEADFGAEIEKRSSTRIDTDYLGTVGAVALDRNGNLAAGTSTGGLTNKMYGRIGDSPIVGAGTWADNRTAAVSGTGQGEYFIREMIAGTVGALMEFTGADLRTAAERTIARLTEAGGTGGIIAMDGEGRVAFEFNTPGMYRGSIDTEGNMEIAIYGQE